ncbi:MAG: aminopeptidase P family protein, partial [Synergistes sp.]|nr:aminopeptidase P family protein [Synergistes sp.]
MKEKIKERIKRLAEETAKAGADAFAVINDESSNWQNLYYLSGFRGTSGALLVRASGEAELLLDGRYIEQGREQSPLPVRPLENNLTQDVTDLIKKIGAKEILCEAYATTHKIWTSLENNGGIWRDGASITETMRRTKDEKETALIKKAAEIGAKAFLETLGATKAGMTEKAFAALLDYNITIAGGEPGFEMIVASGPRSVMPHGRASEREMRSGEWVTVDFGARAGGY